MKISTHVVVLACGALLAPAVRAYDLPVFALGEMRTAPVIDGRVGADEWADAMKTLQFIPLRKDLAFPGEAQVWLGRDRERLFVAARMIVSPHGLVRGPGPVKRRGNGGTQDAFSGDCFEFDFIDDGTATKDSGRHMIVSSTGCYYSSGTDEGHPIAWDPPGFTTASTVTNGWWEFEFSIPLKEAGFTAANAAKHAVRIARNWKYMGTGWGIQSSLTPQESVFEKSAGCAKMPLDAAAPVVQVDDIGLHGHGGENYAEYYPVKFRVRNPTAAEMPLKVRVLGKPVESQPMMMEMPVTLKPGEERAFAERGAVLSDEKVSLEMSVTSADGATVYYTRKFEFQPNFSAIPWLRHDAKGGGVEVKMAYYPSFNKLRARADLSSDKTRGPRAAVTFAVLGKNGRTLASVPAQADKDGVADLIFDVPDLAAETKASGSPDYRLVTTVPGIGAWTNAFVRHVCEWEGNKYGLSGVVPLPFEKVKVQRFGSLEGLEGCKPVELEKDSVVKVVLRDYTIGDFGLWKQVKAAGKEILARPMTLQTSQTSQTFQTSQTYDVDGLMTWTLTLKKGLKLDSLKLVIPMKASEATLMHACVDGLRNNYAGYIPKGEGRVWDGTKAGGRTSIIGDYMPYVWIGGTLRGICVCGENDKGWEIGDLPCQEIVREKDGTVKLILNLVQKPVEIAEDRTIRLGIQATPVKPMQENWRGKDIGALMGACLYFGACGNGIEPFDETTEFWEKMAEARRTGKVDKAYLKDVFDRFIYAGEPGSKAREVCEERFRRHYGAGMNVSAGNKKTGRPFTFYTNARGIEFGCRAGTTYCDEWSRWEYDLPGHVFARHDKRDYDLDPVASYRDYAMWCYKEMIETGACNYIYWDDVYPSGNFDLVPGNDAYRRADGAIQQSNGFFNMRELVRRTAIMQAECGFEHRFNWVHMTNTATAPICSFAGVNYDWEDGADLSTFQDRYGIDYILACSTGRQLGNIVSMMGYIGKTDPENQKRLYRCGTGVMLAFEFQWNRVPQWCALNEKLTAWGYRDAATKVWNFWDEDVAFPVAVKGGQNAALAMARRGEAIVIVSDFDKGGEFAIAPDAAAMGLAAGFKAYDFETGAEIPVENGAAKVTLKKHDFAIVSFR